MRRNNFFLNRGFTLIELLVVVAIIGILTTVVLVATDSSRKKAKDSRIMSDLKEFEKILVLEGLESGNYAKLQTTGGNFITSTSGCNSAFAPPPAGSNYYLDARRICADIVANSPQNNGVSWGLIADTRTNMGVPQDDKYSVMATLNDAPYGISPYFCVGISGNSISTSFSGLGCWSNP